MTEGIVVQKYGGSSVATVDKLREVARLVVQRRRSGAAVVVVVSAMGDATDALLAKARQISAQPDRRELDMLLTVGERTSMSLLAMAIREEGEQAVSLTGSQSGIITTASHANARIMEVRPFRIQDELEAGRIVIVAGYQGVSYKRDITTLGRGGSDTTAVALAAALDATACEIYSDVDGVFTADPRVVADARQIEALGHEEMQTMAAAGARVLNATAVEFARSKGIAIYARKTGAATPGTVIRRDAPTSPCGIRAVAHRQRVALIRSPGQPDALATILEVLSNHGALTQSVHQGDVVECVLPLDDVHDEPRLAAAVTDALPSTRWTTDHGTVTAIGAGGDPSVVLRALRAAASADVHALHAFDGGFTILVPRARVADAVRALHHELIEQPSA